jgi:hypothetical protein
VGPIAQSVYRLATGWTVRGSNPGVWEIFHTCPDRRWGPPSLLYNGYPVFPGGRKRPGRDADPSSPSRAEVWKQSRAISLFSLRDFVACEKGEIYLQKHFLEWSLLFVLLFTYLLPSLFLKILHYDFAIWTVHYHTTNKRPTNASKYQCISTLSHSYMFRRIRGAMFREFSMSLLNFVTACILWQSVWSDGPNIQPSSHNIPPHRRSQYTDLIP